MLGFFGYQDPLTDYDALVRRIRRMWPEPDQRPSDELMELVETAVDKCPHMADLWLMRAELVQRCLGDGVYEPGDAWKSLEAAVRIDGAMVEVHEAMGSFQEDVAGDFSGAEASYLRALELGGGPWVYTGLARVLAKQGRWDEAMASLRAPFCPYHDDPPIEEARQRLDAGETEF